ncbi:MAG: helix-turn-helix domain-containing protein [Pseudonocardiaceae bacterium]|nr:helix-turn-helix domain-containing protein [Pseudonocardiaceae bacterium]
MESVDDVNGATPSGPIDKVADLGRDIGEYIRQQRSTAKISLRQLSKLAGVSNPYLSQIERGLRKPSAEILQQIAKGLRISAEALYVQAGILDEPLGGPVVDAIRADHGLNERQKQILLDVYESFRRENHEDASTSPAAERSNVDIEMTEVDQAVLGDTGVSEK